MPETEKNEIEMLEPQNAETENLETKNSETATKSEEPKYEEKNRTHTGTKRGVTTQRRERKGKSYLENLRKNER